MTAKVIKEEAVFDPLYGINNHREIVASAEIANMQLHLV